MAFQRARTERFDVVRRRCARHHVEGGRSAAAATAAAHAAHAAEAQAEAESTAQAEPGRTVADQLPLAIRHALAADRVVVVALYDPKAKIDGTAIARGGGRRAARRQLVRPGRRAEATASTRSTRRYGVRPRPGGARPAAARLARRPDRRLRRPRHGRPGGRERRLVMRFGRHQRSRRRSPPGTTSWAVSPEPVEPATVAESDSDGRELFVRHARKDGKLVAMLRAVDHGSSCVVEAEVCPHGTTQLVRPGPVHLPDAHQASAFVTEAVAALMYLGCDIQAH